MLFRSQLLNEDGIVINSADIQSPPVKIGDKFKDDFSFLNEIEGGKTYTIRIIEKE